MSWDDGRYGTHLPVLTAAVLSTEGPVLELGAGNWSTPFLHQLCWDRELVTIEPPGPWRDRFEVFRNSRHAFFDYLETYDGPRWAVVLVDGGDWDQRARNLLSLDAELFVAHDTDAAGLEFLPAYRDALRTFKYRQDFNDLTPPTSVVSNYRRL